MSLPPPPPPPPPGYDINTPSDEGQTYDNPNQHLTTGGMFITFIISLCCFLIVQGIFETNRFYKQIYLKRLQKRFEEIGRVPSIPQPYIFGWLRTLQTVTEMGKRNGLNVIISISPIS